MYNFCTPTKDAMRPKRLIPSALKRNTLVKAGGGGLVQGVRAGG